MRTRQLRPRRPLALRPTLAPLRAGRPDPTMRVSGREVLRTCRTPDGPATLALRVLGDGLVDAGAWGPGAVHALDALPALLGEDDDRTGFAAHAHATVARADHRLPGLRICRSGDVEDTLVPTILGQRVTGVEQSRSWRSLVHRHGEPAPGPHGAQGLLVRPPAEFFTALPDHEYARYGVERSRATTIRAACGRVERLQAASAMATGAAEARLRQVPGLGPWSAAIVQRVSFGDPDTVEVGDFHVPNHVCWQLAGEARGDDARMLELLAPFAGQRGRVVALLTHATPGAPRRGPRGEIVSTRTTARRP